MLRRLSRGRHGGVRAHLTSWEAAHCHGVHPLDDMWADLTFERLQRFLASAAREDTGMEAKGTEVHPDTLRRQVCAFANRPQGGYLLLGVSEGAGGFVADGFALPGRGTEPSVWVDSVVRDGGHLQPVPDVETRSWPVGGDRVVAAVRVTPVPVPPCVLRGAVWWRADGRSVTVTDVSRLRELFVAGRGVMDRAQADARQTAEYVWELGAGPGKRKGRQLGGAIGLATTGRAADVDRRIHDAGYQREIERLLEEKILRRDGHAIEQEREWEARAYTRGGVIRHAVERDATVWVRSDTSGAVGVSFRERVEDGTIDELMAWWILGAWHMALACHYRLGGSGDYYVSLRLDGNGLKDVARPVELIEIARGPIALPRLGEAAWRDYWRLRLLAAEQIASVRRETLRAVGRPSYENVLPKRDDDFWLPLEEDATGEDDDWSPVDADRALGLYMGRNRGRRARGGRG